MSVASSHPSSMICIVLISVLGIVRRRRPWHAWRLSLLGVSLGPDYDTGFDNGFVILSSAPSYDGLSLGRFGFAVLGARQRLPELDKAPNVPLSQGSTRACILEWRGALAVQGRSRISKALRG
jgi:hypothetical protein